MEITLCIGEADNGAMEYIGFRTKVCKNYLLSLILFIHPGKEKVVTRDFTYSPTSIHLLKLG